MINTIESFIKNQRLISKGDRVLVAVSGGPDSTALLLILYELRYKLGIELSVAHLDHQLRKNSSRDLKHVRKLSDSLGLAFLSDTVPIRALTKNRSLEEAARDIRFEFLAKAAKQLKANVIALGHTEDDLAETVLMRIIRGSGLSGLNAILPMRRMHNMSFIRPLLTTSKKDILKFLRARKTKFCIDSSNASLKFFRNRVRRKLIPVLEKDFNPNIKKALVRLSQSTTLDYQYLAKQARLAFPQRTHVKQEHHRTRLNLSNLKKIHPSLQRMVMRAAVEDLAGSTRRLTYNHISEIEHQMNKGPIGTIVHLPKGIRVTKKRASLVFERYGG